MKHLSLIGGKNGQIVCPSLMGKLLEP